MYWLSQYYPGRFPGELDTLDFTKHMRMIDAGAQAAAYNRHADRLLTERQKEAARLQLEAEDRIIYEELNALAERLEGSPNA